MAKPYRKVRGMGLLWVGLILAGIAVSIAIAPFVPESLGGWMLLIFSLPVLAGVLLAAFLDSRLAKRRHAGIAAALQELGMHVVLQPTPEEKAAFFQPIAHLETSAGLRSGAQNLKWIAYGPIQGRQALAFEHEFVIGSGKAARVFTYMAICWVSNHGWLTLIRPRIGEGRALVHAHPEITLGDPDFDRDWVIWGEPEAAAAVLTERFRRGLSDSPRGEMWYIGGGFTCCLYRDALDASNFGRFVARSGDIVHG